MIGCWYLRVVNIYVCCLHRQTEGRGGSGLRGDGVGRGDLLDAGEDAVLDGAVELGMLGIVGEALFHLLTRDMVLVQDIVVGTQHLRSHGVIAILRLNGIEAFEKIGVGQEFDHLRGVEDSLGAAATVAACQEDEGKQGKDSFFHRPG